MKGFFRSKDMLHFFQRRSRELLFSMRRCLSFLPELLISDQSSSRQRSAYWRYFSSDALDIALMIGNLSYQFILGMIDWWWHQMNFSLICLFISNEKEILSDDDHWRFTLGIGQSWTVQLHFQPLSINFLFNWIDKSQSSIIAIDRTFWTNPLLLRFCPRNSIDLSISADIFLGWMMCKFRHQIS